MNICSSTPQHGEYTNSSLLEGDVKVRKFHAMLFLRTCMSRKWGLTTESEWRAAEPLNHIPFSFFNHLKRLASRRAAEPLIIYLSRSSITVGDWRAGEPLTSNALTKVAPYFVVAPKMDVILTIRFKITAEIEITKHMFCVLRCRRGRVSAF